MIIIRGANLAPEQMYNVGVFTFWNPLVVGSVRADASGSIGQTSLTYSCVNVVGPSPVNVGFYAPNGLAIARSTVDQVCPNPFDVQ